MRVAVCVPAGAMSHTFFAMDFAAMIGWTCKHTDIVPEIHYRLGTILPEQRQVLCQNAVESGAEFVVMIDSDMRFPNDLLKRLVEHDEDFVGTNVSTRRLPLSVNTYRLSDGGPPQPAIPEHGLMGLEQVMTTGFGIVCIKASVFSRIAFPWFQIPYITETGRYVGEDTYFCSRLKDAGIPIHVDHGLSWAIKHVGDYEYDLEDVMASWGVTQKILVT